MKLLRIIFLWSVPLLLSVTAKAQCFEPPIPCVQYSYAIDSVPKLSNNTERLLDYIARNLTGGGGGGGLATEATLLDVLAAIEALQGDTMHNLNLQTTQLEIDSLIRAYLYANGVGGYNLPWLQVNWLKLIDILNSINLLVNRSDFGQSTAVFSTGSSISTLAMSNGSVESGKYRITNDLTLDFQMENNAAVSYATFEVFGYNDQSRGNSMPQCKGNIASIVAKSSLYDLDNAMKTQCYSFEFAYTFLMVRCTGMFDGSGNPVGGQTITMYYNRKAHE